MGFMRRFALNTVRCECIWDDVASVRPPGGNMRGCVEAYRAPSGRGTEAACQTWRGLVSRNRPTLRLHVARQNEDALLAIESCQYYSPHALDVRTGPANGARRCFRGGGAQARGAGTLEDARAIRLRLV